MQTEQKYVNLYDMKFSELKKRINSGDIKPFYVLTGNDEYLKSSAVRIIKSAVSMPELNALTLDSPTAVQLRDAVAAPPIMSDRRYVGVRTLTDVTCLGAYADIADPAAVLVVTDQPEPRRGKKESRREEEVRRFLSAAEPIDCSPLDLPTIFAWMAAEAKKYEVTVERDAAALLAEYCRSDMSRISGEFGKLASYRMGGRITPDDVRLMVQPEPEYAMWQLSGAIAAKNAAEAMKIYESFDEDARRPETLFGVVQSHFRRLYYSLTEDGETVKKLLGVRDNALYAIKREAAKFGEAALARILLSLAETDEDIKNGTLPRETASEVLILRTVGGI